MSFAHQALNILVLLGCCSGMQEETFAAPEGAQVAQPTDPESTAPVKPAVPEWAVDARWYHVVVPRFHNGDRSNDPENALAWPTEAVRPAPGRGQDKTRTRVRRYGGDLQGLQQRLGYLKELGVNTLYLSGLFRSSPRATGRGIELHHIDPSIGSGEKPVSSDTGASHPEGWTWSGADEIFLRFIEAAHTEGFRVVIEAPFDRAPISASDAEAFQRYCFAVTRRWMDPDADGRPADGVDGWVVADPQHVPAAFWKQWRRHAKAINRDVLLVADVKKDPRPWVKGDQFDVAIDYELAKAVRRYFTAGKDRLETEEFLNQLETLTKQIPKEVQLACPVPLSGPHLGRLLHDLSFDQRHQGNGNEKDDSAADLKGGAQRWQLATFVQYFIPGAPMTFYGEEIGVYCTREDGCLAPIPWPDQRDSENSPGGYARRFAGLIRFLNSRRTVDRPLTRGTLEQVASGENTRRILTLARTLPHETVLLTINCSDARQEISLPVGTPGGLAVVLGPRLHQPLPPRSSPSQRRGDKAKKADASNSSLAPGRAKKGEKGDARPRELIVPLSLGGSRRIVDPTGRIRLLIEPMSVRLVTARH